MFRCGGQLLPMLLLLPAPGWLVPVLLLLVLLPLVLMPLRWQGRHV